MTPTLTLIPLPVICDLTGGKLVLQRDFPVFLRGASLECAQATGTFTETLSHRPDLKPRLTLGEEKGSKGLTITQTTVEHTSGSDNYSLSVRETGAEITASSPKGLFWGLQTFSQLLTSDNSRIGVLEIPCLKISDSPRFQWRGMHLDVSRHFFPVSFVKKYIDLLARHKMNVFHWHLTDDQGWRIEIKSHPRLTEIGAWRQEPDGALYGGFYSQTEIRDIVDYAARRCVTIVPEIEMPGHSLAALAAYPELSCTGGPFTVGTQWGVFDDVYCAGNERTFTFLEDVLQEVAELFPSQRVHIGGDECPKSRWNGHQLCLDRMNRERLADADALQSYFVKRTAKYLSSLGRSIVGWDEILDGGAPEAATIMAWRNAEKGIEAARSGHDVVMTPMSHCYFDHYQAEANEPKAIGGFSPLEKVYAFEPLPDNLPSELSHHILGAQGNVWTEYMHDTKHVEYMVFPRLCALAEVLWSPRESRNLDDFLVRLRQHLQRLDELDVNYRPLSI